MLEPIRIDPDAIGHLRPAITLVRAACEDLGIEYFVIGAAARDLLLEHVHGVRAFRATTDVDAAVAVRDWDQYSAIVNEFIERHGFFRTNKPHRFTRGGIVLDVIPFGEIASESGFVNWPGDTRAMSVLGFPEVYEAAVSIIFDDGPAVRVASLPGVGVLKIVAWNEAPMRRRQDPIDLCAIMTNYDEVVGDLLYTEHCDLLELEDFDLREASSRIYGREVAPLLRTIKVRATVLGVLAANTESDFESRLVDAMGSECLLDFTHRLRCLRAFHLGIEDRLV